jgi:outer membrane protein assembly factor BamD
MREPDLRMNWSLLFPAIALLVSLGCSIPPKLFRPSVSQTVSGIDEHIFIQNTVEKNNDDPNIMMKRADSLFEKKSYAEAVMEYQNFLDLHRGHVLASYALYKLGEGYFKQIIGIHHDPDPIYKALEVFEQLRKNYPGSRWDTETYRRIETCHDYIARVYLSVGQFYYRREAYLAAAHRFEAVLNYYPNVDVAGDALYYLALTYKDLGAEDWAREKLLMLVERYPNNKHTGAGQKLLAKLVPKQPASAVGRAGFSVNPVVDQSVLRDVAFSGGLSPR